MKKDLLYDSLNSHKKLNRISFHTPGHKNKLLSLYKDMFSLDFTELPDTDSLYEAKGAILSSEKNMAEIFNTNQTFFSAGGCTLCIQAMIRLVSSKKNKIIMGRTIHKSAINTVALLGLDPEFIMTRNDCGNFLPGRIYSKDVSAALNKNPDACAVYITSPDYFGVISDIHSISQECKRYNVPLIVDNAHGTHLKFLSKDIHPITLGASITADSAHKTLPVLTGGALLHINMKIQTETVRSAMGLFGSTSPSYPIMSSLDLCSSWIRKSAKTEFSITEKLVKQFLKSPPLLGIETPSGPCDPIRISLNTKSIGISGLHAAEFLRENGIEPEYANENYIILIPTPMNTATDFDKLSDTFKKLICSTKATTKNSTNLVNIMSLPKKQITPREAIFSEYNYVEINKSLKRVCCETICPCPPGIPVIMPGEEISNEVIEVFKRYGINEVKVLK